ncbi:MAG: hypothetical protein CM15mV148_180 [uncultured marine virus]|nr:MAG: hypothetical protein CM15mV148_180 [uncultured marine virus]
MKKFQALVGTGLLAGAYAFRSSENAGENWCEYKMDNGQTFDMRPFFPYTMISLLPI